MKPVDEVLILGGGTAGWLCAAFLARQLKAGQPGRGVRVSVLESEEIGIIGVGEGSFPSLKGTLSLLGMDEADFLERCSATLKQGVLFRDWVRPPGQPGTAEYLHPFSLPSQRPDGADLTQAWLQGLAPRGMPYATAVTLQARAVAAGRAPRRRHDRPWHGALNYAYHFDAAQLAAALRERALALGATRRIGTVCEVRLGEDGGIAGLRTQDGAHHAADLYVDCSGFSARLIGQAMRQPLRQLDSVLFADSAVAMPVPWPRPDAPLPCCTLASAQQAGWIWDIPLRARRGVGYVYSSAHQDHELAEATLRHYVGAAGHGLAARRLRFSLGYREQPWQHNCVAVGLSGGFLEPLESSGIGLIEAAVYLLGFLFPRDGDFRAAARHFNAHMSARYARIVDFLKLHYCLSQRNDSAFWRDNRRAESVPDSLADLLARWRCRPPHRMDFSSDLEMYPSWSWQYVLYGMEYATRVAPASHQEAAQARDEFARLQSVAELALRELPPHRELLDFLPGRAASTGEGTGALAAGR